MTSDPMAETTGCESAWLELLPVNDRKLLMDEWLSAPRLERERLAREWRRTAAVHADRKLARRLSKPLTV